ncbi:cell division initiation protein [Kitasatospora sp. NPDC101801]|uniref:cell division initiation protein n=1 Tax=Kitasatospora sp. NPDC101801 TaxID=3364103 RepID=UPI00380366C6
MQNRLDAIVTAVENARSMPMSASCVVNRAELVGLLQQLREALPAELAQAQSVMADHEQVVADAQAQADQIIQGAHSERGSLISDTEVVLRAQAEADRILGEAKAEVQTKLAEADDYVDSKLANFEVVLTKTLGAVGRGRTKLRGDASVFEQPYDEDATDGEEFRSRVSPSPEVDEYVDVKLATLETVLSKTLEAVGKGRDKLLGKASIDELGAYLAAADEAQQLKDRAEAVAAGFSDGGFDPSGGGGFDANGEEQPWYRAEVPQQQSWPEPTPAAAGWQAPEADQYAAPQYTEVYGGGYDPAGQPQTDPYGYPQQPQPSYGGQGFDTQGFDAYGYQQQQPVYQEQQQPQEQQAYDAYGYPQQAAQVPQQAALDETSFFDTSMIDMTRLRELGGR